jgi:hypothetical protein
MVVSPELALETFAANADEWKTGFSGWTRLRALEFIRLELALDRPTGPGSRLYLLTRLPAGEEDRNAWATFGGVEIGIGWTPSHSAAVIVDEQSRIENARPTSDDAPRPAARAARIAQMLELP